MVVTYRNDNGDILKAFLLEIHEKGDNDDNNDDDDDDDNNYWIERRRGEAQALLVV